MIVTGSPTLTEKEMTMMIMMSLMMTNSNEATMTARTRTHSAERNEEGRNEDNKKNNDSRAAAAVVPTNLSTVGPMHILRNLSLEEFRRLLIIHFAIARSWPSRLGNINKTPAAGVID